MRVPVGEFATASRLLDAGASGVIAPMINTVDDARLFADFMNTRLWDSAVGVRTERWR